MSWFSRASFLAGLIVLGPTLLAVDLVPPASLAVSGITVSAQPQVVHGSQQVLRIDRARARAGWQLRVSVVNGQLQHMGSGSVMPTTVRFTSITALYGADTNGISISADGGTISSGPYKSLRTYDATFQAQLTVPALPRAGAYTGTINFVITEF